MNDELRSRTYTFTDPMITIAAGRRMAGLDFLRALIAGEVPRPPIAATLDLLITEADEGSAVFTMIPGEHHYNPLGMVHGGVVSTLLDGGMGCAVMTTLPAGHAYTTLELKVNFVRAIGLASGTVRCEGRVIHRGQRIATAEGRVIDGAGRLCAHGTTTCMILQLPDQAKA